MVTYIVKGNYTHEKEKFDLTGNLKTDDLNLAAQCVAKLTGNISDNTPRTSGAALTGYVALSGEQTVIRVLQVPRDKQYSPCVYKVVRNSLELGLEGAYKGIWAPLDPELVEGLPQDPSEEDITSVIQATHQKHGLIANNVSLEISIGKFYRAKRGLERFSQKVAEIVSPQPQPGI